MDKERRTCRMDYHKQQFLEPKRSTIAFEKFVSRHTEIRGNVLDLACGGGAVDAYIAKMHPEVIIKGVDISEQAFYMLDKYAEPEVKKRVTLETGDWFHLDSQYVNNFDGVISVQSLSWLENWRIPLEKIVELNPKWISFSSLFYDGRIDYQVKVMNYERQDELGNCEEVYYNIYPLPIIEEFFKERGYTVFEYEPFEIDIDIPKPTHHDLGTYTIKTEEGKRLQISAAMLMPWYNVFVAKQ